jgi:trehalose utilization protein
MNHPIRVTVWNEGRHESAEPKIAAIYPQGIHTAIAQGLHAELGQLVSIKTATLDDDGRLLSDEALARTDVLTWWAHIAHSEVPDEAVDRVQQAVLSGMGLIVLHSGHLSKIFTRLMGTTCSLGWRDDANRELVWSVAPHHPITLGVPQPLVIERHETYSEYFDIPAPDELIFVSSFSGGEVFRSGHTFTRGRGRIFYFSPGDQKYPIFHHPGVRRVLANAVQWATPTRREVPQSRHLPASTAYRSSTPPRPDDRQFSTEP